MRTHRDAPIRPLALAAPDRTAASEGMVHGEQGEGRDAYLADLSRKMARNGVEPNRRGTGKGNLASGTFPSQCAVLRQAVRERKVAPRSGPRGAPKG